MRIASACFLAASLLLAGCFEDKSIARENASALDGGGGSAGSAGGAAGTAGAAGAAGDGGAAGGFTHGGLAGGPQAQGGSTQGGGPAGAGGATSGAQGGGPAGGDDSNPKKRPIPASGCYSGVACDGIGGTCSSGASAPVPGQPRGFSSWECTCKGGVLDCEVNTLSKRCTSGAACDAGESCSVSVEDAQQQTGLTADCSCGSDGAMHCWLSNVYDPGAAVAAGHPCLQGDLVFLQEPGAGCFDQCACGPAQDSYSCGVACP